MLNDFDSSVVKDILLQVAYEKMRPSTIHKPTLHMDRNLWCATLGAVVGVGASPCEAMQAFDDAWFKKIS